MAVADAWFDASQSAGEMEKMAEQRRARHWYAKALPNLGGVSKLRIQKRLTELDATLPKDTADPFSS